MVDELADGPAAFAVGGVDLGLAEVADGLAELLGHLSNGKDGVGTIFGCDAGGRTELADGIARVGGVWHSVVLKGIALEAAMV